jgi:hypothetical protein
VELSNSAGGRAQGGGAPVLLVAGWRWGCLRNHARVPRRSRRQQTEPETHRPGDNDLRAPRDLRHIIDDDTLTELGANPICLYFYDTLQIINFNSLNI